jgi:N-acetylmuramic acid 6-phosphate (MurNAc-6-P) etherase
MVGDIAGVAENVARDALDTCDGQVKNAVLVARGMSAEEAAGALEGAGGNLRAVLNSRPKEKS